MRQLQAQAPAARRSEDRPVRQEYRDPAIRRAKAAAQRSQRAHKEAEQS